MGDLEDIDVNRQMTVSCYIRKLEIKYDHEMPKEIIIVCILFYGNDKDEWDPKYISSTMELSDNTLTQRKREFGSSYGKLVIDYGIFKWKFKIHESTSYGFILGIRKIGEDEADLPTNTWFTNGGYDKGYGFVSSAAKLTGNRGYANGTKYGIVPPKDSIIEMILDLDNLTLNYIINGKHYGKAYDIEKAEYRLGLHFYAKGDSVTLL